MIEVKIDELLEKHERTFYWLAKQTGISYTTLWRLKKGKSSWDKLSNSGEDL
jgi:DNA-binding Xre family transcriptional regulator